MLDGIDDQLIKKHVIENMKREGKSKKLNIGIWIWNVIVSLIKY